MAQIDAFAADIGEIYELVIRASNRYLYLCTHTKCLQLLRYEEDPSFAELAHIMLETAEIIEALSHRLVTLQVIRAKDYCSLMVNMSHAIDSNDETLLNELTDRLRSMPGVI